MPEQPDAPAALVARLRPYLRHKDDCELVKPSGVLAGGNVWRFWTVAHVCNLMGYNPMIDPPCPGCSQTPVERALQCTCGLTELEAALAALGVPRQEQGMIAGRLRCSRCGKSVSSQYFTNDADGDLVVRAWVQCPECIEAEAKTLPDGGSLNGPSRIRQPLVKHFCQDFCPSSWTGHWRDWHRGHGCHLDPGVKGDV